MGIDFLDGQGGLRETDLWRLSDTLSVPDAAMLVAGYSPGDRYLSQDGDYRYLDDPNLEKGKMYQAAFNALRNAILSNKLSANVKASMRGTQLGGEPSSEANWYEITEMPHEEQVTYDMLICRNDPSFGPPMPSGAKTKTNFSPTELVRERLLYVCREPNWRETLIGVEDLKEWLKARGVHPPFFFPAGVAEGFRDKGHHRYSAKLSCAVAEWEAVTQARPSRTPKQTLIEWVRSNGVRYGIGTDGVVSDQQAEEVAKIANWAPGGGAAVTGTSGEVEFTSEPEPVENYKFGYEKLPDPPDDLDEGIPF